jgi:hypothetical protein
MIRITHHIIDSANQPTNYAATNNQIARTGGSRAQDAEKHILFMSEFSRFTTETCRFTCVRKMKGSLVTSQTPSLASPLGSSWTRTIISHLVLVAKHCFLLSLQQEARPLETDKGVTVNTDRITSWCSTTNLSLGNLLAVDVRKQFLLPDKSLVQSLGNFTNIW